VDSQKLEPTSKMDISRRKQRILLTGATGRLGRPVLEALLAEGFAIRVATPDEPSNRERIEWQPADFLAPCDFQQLVEGCDAVIHLAAELNDMSKMERVNGDATRALVQAAEKNGIRLFLYTSSVCVYGTPRQHLITEETPTISTERGQQKDFATVDYLIEYSRTKLLGEHAIIRNRKHVNYIIFRPTNIADDNAILGALDWSAATKLWRANRYTHQIHSSDVVAAIVFMLKRHLRGANNDSKILIYNLSNDDEESNKYISLFQEAARRSERTGFVTPVRVPGWLDWQKDKVKFRRLSIGYPPGMVRYLPTRLLSDGFIHPLGIKAARSRALDSLSKRA
jgi:nucleoside-diphosphate-sugar epimerase